MASQLKRVSFGEFEIEEFMLPKKKADRNACVTGEHQAFWQRHECQEKIEHKGLSKRTHALLALGRASELCAAVEEYMKEPVVKARRPPAPARPRSRSVRKTKVRHVPPLQEQRALDEQEATASKMCEPWSEAEEEDDVVLGNASSFASTFDEEVESAVLSSKAACQAEEDDDLLDGSVSNFRKNFLRRHLRDVAPADPAQQLEHDLPLSPEPPRADDMLADAQPRSYRRPLRAYMQPVAAASQA